MMKFIELAKRILNETATLAEVDALTLDEFTVFMNILVYLEGQKKDGICLTCGDLVYGTPTHITLCDCNLPF